MACEPESGNKREAIIAAAEWVFAEKGFHPSRVEEIARRAGVGKGTVYEYFDSKEHLFREMLAHLSSEYLDSVTKGMDATAGVAEMIAEIVNQHLRFLREHQGAARLLLADHFDLSSEVYTWLRTRKQEKIDFARKLVQEGINRGELREGVDPLVTAHLVFGATFSLAEAVVLGDNHPGPDAADRVAEMILKGIEKRV